MATALVTRPREDARGVARELTARGFEVMVEPLLDIVPVDAEIDTAGLQGILATSANGIRALARALAARDLPVWAVGDASARTARELGYTSVESAGGDVETLAALVAGRCDPAAGALLHATGSVTAGDLGGRLGAAGFSVRRVVLYQARTAQAVSAGLKAALAGGGIDLALFFSPRTAATFATLVGAAGLGGTTARMVAYALSPAVAAALAALPWAAVRVAAAPTQAALLAALDEDLTVPKGPPQRTTMTDSDQPKTDEPARPDSPAEPAPQPDPDAEPVLDPEQEAAARAAESRPLPKGVVVAVMVLLAVAAALVLGWPYWHPPAEGETPAPAIASAPAASAEADSLRGELAATRDRLHALEMRLAQPPAPADLGPVEGRLGQAEAALKALQAQPQVPARLVDEVAGLSAQVAELKRSSADAAAVLRLADRVEKAESAVRDMQARRSSAAGLLLAVGQLRQALAAAMPYDAELRALKALAGNDAEVVAAVEVLAPRAVAGIPTAAVLVARFQAQAPAIVRAQVLPETEGWWRQTLARLASLVTIEREDGAAAGTTPAAIVARAEAALLLGDLAGAAAEVETLSGGPAEQAAPWLADVRARLAADKAASELTAHVVAAIGAGQ